MHIHISLPSPPGTPEHNTPISYRLLAPAPPTPLHPIPQSSQASTPHPNRFYSYSYTLNFHSPHNLPHHRSLCSLSFSASLPAVQEPKRPHKLSNLSVIARMLELPSFLLVTRENMVTGIEGLEFKVQVCAPDEFTCYPDTSGQQHVTTDNRGGSLCTLETHTLIVSHGVGLN
ncbi:hypothetical protein E2C01_067126 [Portunus trituberculatus]|uniref:Uncharacterized protein n=1 Tax=Portunus trituberculatus TaxID=210409 RepID=A0A5B7HNA6_PORTR|nr:hypothetical protein [Portunus trituberculatus]